ncbi:AAA family ATPase [Methylobacterium sp. J-078]|uniref:AAA family ATPase n=1 Tax=Methylobacterium sp. J-078 TaxID=2836657 RepID=UPI001FBAACE4|nr:AAA family ATPase [Methylobacterium sp. J-078]MCJ2044148.1 AAA family ATPase [Methylobacterium sp. J-078]
MKNTSRGAASAVTLDAVLNGTLPPPSRHDSPFRLLELILTVRCPRDRPRRRDLLRFGDDDGVLGLWQAAWSTAEDVRDKGWTDPRRAHTGYVRLLALLETCERRLQELDERLDLEPDDLEDAVVLRVELEQLAGAAAGCLAECGDVAGRDYCRERAAYQVEHGLDGHRYASALVGLSADARYTWRPGNPGLGALASALQSGDATIHHSVRASSPEPDEPETAWLTEARAKSAREKAERERAAAGPSLVVLASVEHLPGSAENGSKAGRSTGSTARTEWAPLAGKALPLARVPDLAEARATLVSEFPDDASVIDAILVPLAGRSFVHLPPTLLLGPPGTGKSRLTRRLGEVLGLAVTVYSCGGVADSSLIGTSRQWSTGRATVPLQAIKQAGAASVLVVLDELSRAGTRSDNGRLVDGVLALTEAETSRRYQDPFLECATDLSAVSWLATSNTTAGLDPALLSRFRVLELDPRTPASLPSLTAAILRDIRAERGLDEVWLPALDEEEAGVLAENWQGGSVRVLRRLIETVLASRETLATRN